METVRIELNGEIKSHTCKAVGISLKHGQHVTTSDPRLIKYCRSYPEKFSVTLLKVSEEEVEDNKQVSSQYRANESDILSAKRMAEESNISKVLQEVKPKRKPGRKKKVERKAVMVDND